MKKKEYFNTKECKLTCVPFFYFKKKNKEQLALKKMDRRTKQMINKEIKDLKNTIKRPNKHV